VRQGVTALLVPAVVLVVAACGILPPAGVSEAGDQMATTVEGTRTTWTLRPWPFTDGNAFLCLDHPEDFDPSTPENPDPGSCVPLDFEPGRDVVSVSFDAAADPAGADRIAQAGPPWVLAIAGRVGLTSWGSRRQIVDSPVPSDPGPS